MALKPRVVNFPNGIKLLMQKTSAINDIAFAIDFPYGSIYEEKKTLGAAHFNEHMVFKSTPKKRATEIMWDVEREGGLLNAATTFDRTSIEARAADLRILDVIHDAFINYEFDRGEFGSERSVIKSELSLRDSNPTYKLSKRFIELLFGDHPLSLPVGGIVSDIDRLKIPDVVAEKKQFYLPDKLIISVAGNFNERKLSDKIKNTFGRLESKNFKELILSPVKPKEKFETVTSSEVTTAFIAVGLPSVSVGHPDEAPLDALKYLIAGGSSGDFVFSSRLFKNIRHKYGLGYATGGEHINYKGVGLFDVGVFGFEPKKVGFVKNLILNEFEDLKKKIISPQEFIGMKKSWLASRERRREGISGRANIAANLTFAGLPFDHYDKAIKNLTREQMQECARKYFNKFVAVALVPA